MVFGSEGRPAEPPTTTPPPGTTSRRRPATPRSKAAIADAQKAYDDGRGGAAKESDWEAYGKAQEDLEDALPGARDGRPRGRQPSSERPGESKGS